MTKGDRKAYVLRCLGQTLAWADGISFHNAEDNECCPDFSCCEPKLFEKNQDKRRDYLTKFQIKHGVIQ